MNITPYEKGNIFNKDPLRPKNCCYTKEQIQKLEEQTQQKGYTIVPLQVYLKKWKSKDRDWIGKR